MAVSFAMRKTLPNPPAVRTAEEITAQGTVAALQMPPNRAAGPRGGIANAAKHSTGRRAALQMPPNTAQGQETVQAVVTAPPPGPGETFPAFRGKGSRGFAEGSNYPITWDGAAGKGVVWKVKIQSRV
ncbi:MAG: hypothetical protein MZV63_62790 [Marinilabiliales bacterium]|nr:hypothetical protein [Marinilabiliales bacterium]